ncbi:MAG: AAA-like domain-containing protein [Cyanobacteriota bacterium]|nr:AAA-like domain-containing protein [Cyanobacteriota bacterium]
MTNNSASDYYQVGGSLKFDAPSYVERQADEKLYNALKRGKCCYVLNCRQMGKSSLRVQIMQRLKKEGVNCASIDFSKMGTEHLTPDWWYRGVMNELWRGFDLLEKVDLKKWLRDLDFLAPQKQLDRFIEDVILASFPGQQIVIFIDEIDSVRSLEFSVDDFFALVRACYNQRVDNEEYDRLGFAMFGVVKPSDLIRQTKRTPFNIGIEIELTGFKIDEIKALVWGLTEKVKQPKNVLEEILKWTGGQPFLTQKICQLVATSEGYIARGEETKSIEMLVKRRAIENWESQDTPEHLKTIQNRLLPKNKDKDPRSAWERQKEEQRIAELLEIYQEILKNGEVSADYSYEQMDLQLSGLVVEELGKLKLYNRIYGEVFDEKWVNQALKNLCPFSQNVAAWEDSKFKDRSRLLRGKALKEARLWADNKTLSELDRKFLDASDRSDKLERKRKGLLFGGLVGAIAAIGVMAWQIWRIPQDRSIEIATELAKQAEEIINSNPDNLTRSMLLAIEADRRAPSVEKAGEILQQGLNLLPYPITPPLKHQERINKIAFSPDSKYLATASDDNTARVWNAETGQPLGNPLKHDDAVADVVFSPDNKYIATASWDNTARVWNTFTGERSMQLEHQNAVLAVAFAIGENVKFIATASNDKTAQLWNFSTGERYNPLKHDKTVLAIAFSPNGRYLATASADRTARVWDTYRDSELAKFPHPRPVVAIAFSPDGKYIATISNDNMARVWEWPATTNEPAMGFEQDGTVNAIAFSPDGKYLATASSDNTARVWDLTNEQQVVSLDHEASVHGVTFNTDGQYLATASGTNTARVWKVDGGQEVARLNHQDRVRAIAFSPDGQYLATASEDGTARLWNPWPKNINDDEEAREEVCQRLTRNLTIQEWEEYLPGQPYRPTCPL